MNILPHKSWHVYNKNNVDKVRQDEAKAKEEEDKKLERQQLADREARLTMLRDRANQRAGIDSADTASSKDAVQEAKHINFWEELESGHVDPAGPNPEVAAEKQQEREKWEKQITMYLAKEAKGPAPWYAAAKRLSDEKQDDKSFDEAYRKLKDPKEKQKALKRRKREIRDIEREDPLNVIRTSLKGRDSNPNTLSSNRDKYADKRHRKEKETSNHKSHTSNSMERLREQRIARERAERQRAAALVKGPVDEYAQEKSRRYNSQFNPEDTERAHQRHRRH
ncbi:hypothetical protein BC943DRAFT_319469 [Umbelopsis sp. AD052]|nr:hypothetical protein BC943DRAFT_319469 [Umbelopsis sp. AD052]